MTSESQSERKRFPDAINVVGIDWSGARDAGRRAWVCRAEGVGAELRVTDLHRVADRGGRVVEDLLAYVEASVVEPPGVRWVGLDFPFSVTHGVAEHLGIRSWRALVSSWETRFPDAAAFARDCTAASIAVARAKEGKRRTDTAVGAPMSPWNLRLFRQTYHGVRLLRRLAGRRAGPTAVPPRASGGEVRVIEICPAATLAATGERSQGYKGRRATHAARRTHLLGLVRDRWGLRISRELASALTADQGGDALDVVLAAVSTYHHAARLRADEHAEVRADADVLEGYIYAGRRSSR